MSEPGARGVIVAHADLAEGLLSAVRRITGVEAGVLTGVSNEGLGPEAIRDRLDRLLDGGPGVVFSDLREGSCGIVARKVCLDRADRVLVTGVNLPMLLDFVVHRDEPLEELGRRLVERGQAAVTTFQGSG
jgi:mannose/fructose-specific phosphotransferase system component IIA